MPFIRSADNEFSVHEPLPPPTTFAKEVADFDLGTALAAFVRLERLRRRRLVAGTEPLRLPFLADGGTTNFGPPNF